MPSVNRQRVFRSLVALLALVLSAVLTLGPGWAQEPEGDSQPEAQIAITGEVSSRFTYQGILSEDGVPVTGTRNLAFHLFSDSSCTTPVAGLINVPGVEVEDGLFSVELAVPHSDFNGQALWLRVQVGSTVIACQEILPVPYALSLRPGAIVKGTKDELLVLENTVATSGDSDTLIVRNASGSGEAVEVGATNNAVVGFATNGFGVWGRSDTNHGVYGKSNSVTHAGVLAEGTDAGPDLIVGGNTDTGAGDDGRIHSDPDYAGSDLLLVANDAVRIDLEDNADGEDADFEIYDKDDHLLFDVDESGDVTYGGAGIAAFPRPAYDSGWQSLVHGEARELTHSLGGNSENYVVDLMCKSNVVGYAVNGFGLGGDFTSEESYGAFWRKLTTATITVERLPDDRDCQQVRVRIWVYK